ncbi:hypothetical protein, partial [Mordavella massiliensis]|uniref:hypothetical protein n=1 Tax=Mordavella massiliensis TaxID=1871024 RepID=UPI00195AD614
YSRDAGSDRKVEVGVFYFNYSGIPCEKISIILLSAYYHMEKHYISGMSDSNAATAVSVFLLHSGKSQCF